MFSATKYKNNLQNSGLSTGMIILFFAIAHAAVAMAGRALHYYDDVPLTILTISMIVVISIRHSLRLEIAAIITLVASFVGFLAGVYGERALIILTGNTMLAPGISTFVITEIAGWGTYLVARSKEDYSQQKRESVKSAYIAIIALTILIFRVAYMLILRRYYTEQESIYSELEALFSNTFAVLLLICLNVISVHLYFNPNREMSARWKHLAWFVSSIVITTTLTTLCVLYGPWQESEVSTALFIRMFLISLLVCIAAFTLLLLGYYVVNSRRELLIERQQTRLAQYQYDKFKSQVNPHFLFNSLNILDALVQEGDKVRAGTFIRKLAGIYRYMLHTESECFVSLREEMAFVDMYIDLIKERFREGLDIGVNIDEESYKKMVVPCSIQQLIENATKHNIVNLEQPLHITISTSENWLIVENNLQPRISARSSSTRLGLKTLAQQYYDIAEREIEVEKSSDSFRVRIPLIKPRKQ